MRSFAYSTAVTAAVAFHHDHCEVETRRCKSTERRIVDVHAQIFHLEGEDVIQPQDRLQPRTSTVRGNGKTMVRLDTELKVNNGKGRQRRPGKGCKGL